MVLALLYHDVVAPAAADSSGFPGAIAARYKLAPDEFARHMDAIAAAIPEKPAHIDTVRHGDWLLTFDDGGISSLTTAAALEKHGWRGHFMVATDFIGTPGFLDMSQIRDLHGSGHVIGSHSCSHPRMTQCDWPKLLREWRTSRDVLADIIGQPITSASVPGGFYSTLVARAAAEAGYSVLFNSEPSVRPQRVADCSIVGRFTIYRGMTPRDAAALAQGKLLARVQQQVTWNVKKCAKAVGGSAYIQLCEKLLALRYNRKS